MDEDLNQAHKALAIGAYHQAFEIFFMVEQGNTDSNFVNCCRMAMQGQLSPENLRLLFDRLDDEVRGHNGRVIYNYALVVERLGGHTPKAIELLQRAKQLGIVEAESSLNKLIFTGSL
jgi:hypothetical protein